MVGNKILKIPIFKGHNVDDSDLIIKADSSPDCKNVRIDNPIGALNNNIGMSKLNTLSHGAPITGLFQLNQHLFVRANDEIRYTLEGENNTEYNYPLGWTDLVLLNFDESTGEFLWSGNIDGEPTIFFTNKKMIYQRPLHEDLVPYNFSIIIRLSDGTYACAGTTGVYRVDSSFTAILNMISSASVSSTGVFDIFDAGSYVLVLTGGDSSFAIIRGSNYDGNTTYINDQNGVSRIAQRTLTYFPISITMESGYFTYIYSVGWDDWFGDDTGSLHLVKVIEKISTTEITNESLKLLSTSYVYIKEITTPEEEEYYFGTPYRKFYETSKLISNRIYYFNSIETDKRISYYDKDANTFTDGDVLTSTISQIQFDNDKAYINDGTSEQLLYEELP